MRKQIELCNSGRHIRVILIIFQGKFLWPGYGENSRVLDWILQRLDNKEKVAQQTPIGYIPTKESLNTEGLADKVDFDQLFAIDKDFWLKEVSLQVFF